MKVVELDKFCWLTFPAMVFGWLVNPDDFELGNLNIEKKFKKLHPSESTEEFSCRRSLSVTLSLLTISLR